MVDLTDNEIEEILDCLAEQGKDYVISKKHMREILKKNAKKSDSSKIDSNSEDETEISKVDDTEISKVDTSDEIENSIIEKNIEKEIVDDINDDINDDMNDDMNGISDVLNDAINDAMDDEMNDEINDDVEDDTNRDINRDINNNSDELDKIMEDANKRLKETLNNTLNKTQEVKKEHSRISTNLKNIRQKLDENYNTILEKQDKISVDYISKLNTIKDSLKECISRKKTIVPPLNLEELDKSDNSSHIRHSQNSYSKEELYNKLHNKILNRSEIKINNPIHNRYPPPTQNGYNPLNRPTYSNNGFMTERPSIRNPPPPLRPSSYLADRLYPPQTSRLPNRYSSSFLNRYPQFQTPPHTPPQPPQPPPNFSRFNDFYQPLSETYEERYPHTQRDRPRSNSIYDKYDKYKDPYINFDELCKKYETDKDKDGEHEIIITAAGPPSNVVDIINNALDKFEKEFYMSESKNEKATLRSIFDKLKNNKKQLPKYDKDEMTYYESLPDKKKDKIDKLEIKISNINNIKTPLRFRVLQSNLPLYNKSMIINKIEDLFSNKLMGGSEITKYSNWVNSLLKVPFKKYKKLPIDVETSNEEDIGKYLIDVKKTLDTAVYGHTKTKEQVIQIIAQWITNPDCIGNCIGIQGVMGNGKTTLVKNGIAKAIGRPFAFITLGGCSDSSFLEGHNYTYEGSMWGKIVDVLMECKCMNPVFYFDELDKVSDTPKGEEIINSLIHLTDSSQNNQYADKYFNGVEFDLSKSLFIFSYNDITKINPILLDRLICIKTASFELDDKIHIAQKYLLREIYTQLKIKEDTYKINDDNIKYIIETYTGEEGGVRTLKKHLYNIFSKFNLLNLTKNDDTIKYSFDLEKDVLEEKIITNDIIDVFIKDKSKDSEDIDESIKHWYM